MANKRITDFTKVNNFSGDGDLIPIVINTGTVPINASITKANFIAAIGAGSFVTLDTAQTITGEKTFDADINFTGERYIYFEDGQYLEISDINGDNYIAINNDLVDINGKSFSLFSTTSVNGVYTDGDANDPLIIDARENSLVFDLGTNGVRATPNIGDVLVCTDTSGKVEWQSIGSGLFVTLDTAQTITETKTFDTGDTDTKIVVNNLTETSKGIVINNDGGADVSQETVGLDINTTGYGYGLRVRNDDIGFGIYGEDNGNSAGIAGVSNGIGSALFGRANGGGKALFLTGDGSGDRIVVQNTSLQTVYTLDKDGNVNANSFRSSIVTATGVTGTYNLDYKATDNWDLTLTGATTLTESNLPASSEAQTLFIFATGGSITLPATGTNYTVGTYDGAVNNWIVIKYFNSKRVITITQPD